MHLGLESLTVLAVIALMATPAMGVKPTQDEMKTAKQWVTEHFKPAKGTAGQPFSFVYGGNPRTSFSANGRSAKPGSSSTRNRPSSPFPSCPGTPRPVGITWYYYLFFSVATLSLLTSSKMPLDKFTGGAYATITITGFPMIGRAFPS